MPEVGARSGAPPAVLRYHQVDSTNRVAAQLAHEGAPHRTVVVADHQTAGRGRRGRTWEAPPGSSLLVSVLLRPDTDGWPLSTSTVACALAASDACLEVAGLAPRLKWPNDLVVGGRKLGGVLAELVDGRSPAVVVGLGINLGGPIPFPDHLAAIAVTVEAAIGALPDRDALLDAFLRHLDGWWASLGGADGRRHMIAAYAQRCDTLGRPVRVERPGGAPLEGVATAVAADGALVVASGGVTHEITAGDVVHLTVGP